MSLLKVLRTVLFALVVVAAFAFTMYNAQVRVGPIRLPFLEDRQDVWLLELMLYPLLLGIFAGMSVGLLKIVELQAVLRKERRSRQKVQTELTALRNLPLEDLGEEERPESGGES